MLVTGEVNGAGPVYAFCHLRRHHAGGVSHAYLDVESAGCGSVDAGMQSMRGDPAGLCAILPAMREGTLID